MAESMDQLEQLERQTWRKAVDAVNDALATELESAQSDILLQGDLPGRLATAVADLNPDLRSIAGEFATLAGQADLNPSALVEAYLNDPGTRALSALAGHILAKGDEDGGFYEGKLRPMLLAKLPDLTGDKEAPGGEAPTSDEGTTIDTAAPVDEAATREEAPTGDTTAPGDGTATRDEVATGDTTAPGDEAPTGDEVALGNKATTGDRPENSIDQQAWLLTLFLARGKNWGDPPAEWLTSAKAYFDQKIKAFKDAPPKRSPLKRVGRKEQLLDALSPREKKLFDSTAALQALVGEDLAAETTEAHHRQDEPKRRLLAIGLALLAVVVVIGVILAFTTGLIPWPFGAAESTAETPGPGATAESTTGAVESDPTPTISGEELTPEPPPTSAPAAAGALVADGPGWLCAAGVEWRQPVTVTNTGEADTTYTIALMLGDQPGGAVHSPPGSPGDCANTEPAPDIILKPDDTAKRLLIFPNVPGGGRSPRAELRPAGADTALPQPDLPEPQALSVSLKRPEGALEAYGLRQGMPLVVPFLLQANSPGNYELACAPEGEVEPGEGTSVTVSDIEVQVEATCTVTTEEALEEAENWRASVFPLSSGRGAEVAQAQDSANGFVVEPTSYKLEVTPGEALGIMWVDDDIDSNDQVGIVQIYELRNTGNVTYSLDSRVEFTNGLSGFYGAAAWTADVPLDASLSLVAPIEGIENGRNIQLSDANGKTHELNSLDVTTESQNSFLISATENLALRPCPHPTTGAEDTPPECVVKFVIWFRATGMRGISASQPVEYSATFRPVPDLANPELVDWGDPELTLLNSAIKLEDQPDRVIELLSD